MKPSVYLLSRPQLDVKVFFDFLREEKTDWHRTPNTTPSEEIVELAGRICYMSFGDKQSPKTNRDYIRNLISSGHESVLEHVSWTFLLAGVSRALTHQLVRHRVGIAFSQLSQQYHEETDAGFIEPSNLQNSPTALQAWREAVATAQQSYRKILNSLSHEAVAGEENLDKKEMRRAIRSAARSVLPNAIETKIVVTANARILRHLFRVRGSIPGDIEMRETIAALFRVVQPEAPSLFFDFRLEFLRDLTPILVHESSPSEGGQKH